MVVLIPELSRLRWMSIQWTLSPQIQIHPSTTLPNIHKTIYLWPIRITLIFLGNSIVVLNNRVNSITILFIIWNCMVFSMQIGWLMNCRRRSIMPEVLDLTLRCLHMVNFYYSPVIINLKYCLWNSIQSLSIFNYQYGLHNLQIIIPKYFIIFFTKACMIFK